MNENNHLFNEALTLKQLLKIFPLPNGICRGLQPNFDMYAISFADRRFPNGDNHTERRYVVERRLRAAIQQLWCETEELAVLSEVVEVLTLNLLLQCSIDFAPLADNNVPWIPRVHIALSSRQDCWNRLMESNYPQGYEPNVSPTNEDFIREIAYYFKHLPATECAYLTYAISSHRYEEWFRHVAQYEIMVIRNERTLNASEGN